MLKVKAIASWATRRPVTSPRLGIMVQVWHGLITRFLLDFLHKFILFLFQQGTKFWWHNVGQLHQVGGLTSQNSEVSVFFCWWEGFWKEDEAGCADTWETPRGVRPQQLWHLSLLAWPPYWGYQSLFICILCIRRRFECPVDSLRLDSLYGFLLSR